MVQCAQVTTTYRTQFLKILIRGQIYLLTKEHLYINKLFGVEEKPEVQKVTFSKTKMYPCTTYIQTTYSMLTED